MNNKITRNIIILLIVFSNIGCDQVTKNIARENVDYHEYIEVINDNLIITKVENTGAFLGLGNELSETYWNILMLGLPILVLFSLLFYLLAKNDFNKTALLGLSFIVGGGFGNIIDRYLYKSVTDFLYIDIGIAHTGIFNMADVSVMIGVFLILFQYVRDWRKPAEIATT